MKGWLRDMVYMVSGTLRGIFNLFACLAHATISVEGFCANSISWAPACR